MFVARGKEFDMGRQKPQLFVLQAAFKSLDQGKIAKDEISQVHIL